MYSYATLLSVARLHVLILEKLGRNSTMNKKHIGFMLKLINDRMTNKFNRLLKEKKVTV